MSASSEPIRIQAEPQPDNHVLRLVVESHPIHPGGSVVCSSREEASGSPLLEALLGIDGVTQAWIAGHHVTLQKFGERDWPSVAREAGAAIREFLQSGKRFQEPSAAVGSDRALLARIQAVLDEKVNPGVAGHGGKIELVEVRGRAAHLKMSGGCQGCGAAQMTLRQGVEKTLRALVPEISEVIDVTDHAAGRNPYFSKG